MDIPTYAQQAIDRWTLQGMLAPFRGHRQGRHDPSTCGCLVCADGREALGLMPLRPSWGRRQVPYFARRGPR